MLGDLVDESRELDGNVEGSHSAVFVTIGDVLEVVLQFQEGRRVAADLVEPEVSQLAVTVPETLERTAEHSVGGSDEELVAGGANSVDVGGWEDRLRDNDRSTATRDVNDLDDAKELVIASVVGAVKGVADPVDNGRL